MIRASWLRGVLLFAAIAFLSIPSCGGEYEKGAECGDGELQAGEECDDGNEANDDGCSTTCVVVGWIQIVNNSTAEIWYFFVSPTSSGSWGKDQLGNMILYPGQKRTVYSLPVGTYDLRATNRDASRYWEQRNVDLTWVGLIWTLNDG